MKLLMLGASTLTPQRFWLKDPPDSHELWQALVQGTPELSHETGQGTSTKTFWKPGPPYVTIDADLYQNILDKKQSWHSKTTLDINVCPPTNLLKKRSKFHFPFALTANSFNSSISWGVKLWLAFRLTGYLSPKAFEKPRPVRTRFFSFCFSLRAACRLEIIFAVDAVVVVISCWPWL